MSHLLTSWRLLVAGLGCAVVLLAALAASIDRMQTERALESAVQDAELVSTLLLEGNLPQDGRSALTAEALRLVDHGVERLEEEGRLVGLQVLAPDGHSLYSDSADAEDLSGSERGALAAVLAGEPQVDFEHEQARQDPTVTVLLEPHDAEHRPSGLVAEVLLPEDEITAALQESSRRLYGATAVLVVALAGCGVVVRRRVLARERQAVADPLTGLGNRALLASSAALLLRERPARAGAARSTALLLLDLDGFKAVNDTLGHAVGDELLVQVAETLRGVVRPGDVVTRLGGDEFGIFVPDLPDAAAGLRVAEQVSAALHRPYVVDRVALEVGVSIGVAVSPDDGTDLQALLRRADVAMYQAKRDGGGARVYDAATDPHDKEQLGLLSQLRTAVDQDQLRLHFQPKAALRGGRTVGFEALVRWQHPELGLLPPAAFVPVAERTALMRPLTAWVLRAAIDRCAEWREHGWDVDVAVNIAPSTLLDPQLPGQLSRLLADRGLPGSALELEITETAVMVDPVRAGQTLRALREMEVSVSIDDFGAGYTSLSYLKTLPVHSLKIDRGFITDMLGNAKDEAVARSVVSLGHDLGLTVVAEGVESADVRQRLLELGCDEMQGFLLARPMPASEVLPWLADQRRPGWTGGEAVAVGAAVPSDAG